QVPRRPEWGSERRYRASLTSTSETVAWSHRGLAVVHRRMTSTSRPRPPGDRGRARKVGDRRCCDQRRHHRAVECVSEVVAEPVISSERSDVLAIPGIGVQLEAHVDSVFDVAAQEQSMLRQRRRLVDALEIQENDGEYYLSAEADKGRHWFDRQDDFLAGRKEVGMVIAACAGVLGVDVEVVRLVNLHP